MSKRLFLLLMFCLTFFAPVIMLLACARGSAARMTKRVEMTGQPRIKSTSLTGTALPNQELSMPWLRPADKPADKPVDTDNAQTIIALQNNQKDKINEKVSSSQGKENRINPAEPVILQETEQLLPLNFMSVLFPDDFKIGPVFNTYQLRSDQARIYTLVNDFLNSLISKEIRKELIEERRRALLSISLEDYLKSELTINNFRLGKIQMDGADSGSIKIRFFNNKAASNGAIYLLKNAESWFISDVQINFLELSSQGTAAQKEKYKPSAWSNYDY